MISLSSLNSSPSELQSTKINQVITSIKAKVKSSQPLSEKDFKPYWRSDMKIRKAIWIRTNRKCCYCERPRDLMKEADIDHFRPKTSTREDGNPGYWWLAYDWNNLFFSCKACNQTKSNRFPLTSGNRARTPIDNISSENPFLPHPIDENPEQFIGYQMDESSPVEQARPYGKDKDDRGKISIRVLGLDRQDLIDEQSRSLLTLEAVVAKYYAGTHNAIQALQDIAITDIKRFTTPQNDFAGLKRAFFKARGLGTFISQDK